MFRAKKSRKILFGNLKSDFIIHLIKVLIINVQNILKILK